MIAICSAVPVISFEKDGGLVKLAAETGNDRPEQTKNVSRFKLVPSSGHGPRGRRVYIGISDDIFSKQQRPKKFDRASAETEEADGVMAPHSTVQPVIERTTGKWGQSEVAITAAAVIGVVLGYLVGRRSR